MPLILSLLPGSRHCQQSRFEAHQTQHLGRTRRPRCLTRGVSAGLGRSAVIRGLCHGAHSSPLLFCKCGLLYFSTTHSAAALSPLSSSGDSFGVGLRHGFEDIFLQLCTFFFLEQSSWCAILGGLFFLPDECVRARLQTGHLGPAWLINQSVRPVSKPRPFLVAQVPTASVTCDTGEGPSAGPAWTWAPSLSFLSCGECDIASRSERVSLPVRRSMTLCSCDSQVRLSSYDF